MSPNPIYNKIFRGVEENFLNCIKKIKNPTCITNCLHNDKLNISSCFASLSIVVIKYSIQSNPREKGLLQFTQFKVSPILAGSQGSRSLKRMVT